MSVGDLLSVTDGKVTPMHAETPSISSWTPIDLRPVLSGEAIEEQPTMMRRTDGLALIYPGRMHGVVSETEGGKTWFALTACADEMAEGRKVLYLDFEDSAIGIVGRLRSMGVPAERIAEQFIYVRPYEPVSTRELESLVLRHDPSLVVIDGVTEVMTLCGLDPLNNRDVAQFMALLPRRITDLGPATLSLDHVTKSKESRGRWAIGAQHKLAAVDGANYLLDVVEPFGRGREGLARIEVTKDRPGFVRGAAVGGRFIGDLHLSSDADGSVVAWVTPPTGASEALNLPKAAAGVLSVLEDENEPLTVAQIQDRIVSHGVWPKGYNRETVRRSLIELRDARLADGTDTTQGQTARWWKT